MTRAVLAAIEDRRQVSGAAPSRPRAAAIVASAATGAAPAIPGARSAAETLGDIAYLGALQPEATSAVRVNAARTRLEVGADELERGGWMIDACICIAQPTRIARALYTWRRMARLDLGSTSAQNCCVRTCV